MDRYARQTIFRPLGPDGQARLGRATVTVIGCGALGTHSAELLARAGVGAVRLIDRDVVEWSNLHRQGGFEESHARDRAPKADALAAWLRRINSTIRVEAHAVDFNFTNALGLAEGSSLLVDGTDNLPVRFLLNDVSYRLGVPWIYAGAVGSAAHVQVFSGRNGPCLRCQMPELPPPGVLGTCDTEGVIGPAAAVAAGWQAALALRVLAEGDAGPSAGVRVILDPWNQRARTSAVAADPQCVVCAQRRFEVLEGRFAERATVLCGRSAVQVLPAQTSGAPFDLAAAASRLRSLGPLEEKSRFVRVESAEGFTLTLFADGRAVFDGLTDTVRARTLYSRFVGQ